MKWLLKNRRRLGDAAKKAISKLQVRTIRKGDKETESDFDNCAVCIEGYKPNDVVRILPCRDGQKLAQEPKFRPNLGWFGARELMFGKGVHQSATSGGWGLGWGEHGRAGQSCGPAQHLPHFASQSTSACLPGFLGSSGTVLQGDLSKEEEEAAMAAELSSGDALLPATTTWM
ncbi:UNVERIFIED_CONTAM: hypothetical protein K2H54_044433 [Gekko kuhli]